MRILSWVLRFFSKKPPNQSGSAQFGFLREFVYLDEVSVYSILASFRSGIATEFTESQTASLNSTDHDSASVGVGANKIGVGSRTSVGRSHGSQVLRKAIIQTSFKELYDLQKTTLALVPPDSDQPTDVHHLSDLEKKANSLTQDRWIVDPNTVRRGQLLEAEVELEAESIFRVTSVITTLRELLEQNEELVGKTAASQLTQMRSIAQVLDNLLSGLIPIRGRLVDYKSVKMDNREVLVHHRLLDQLTSDTRSLAKPVYIVGVAERDLFWKDIRRILFSGAQYTVYCRLSGSGLADIWHPVKVASVLSGIMPQFDNLIRDFGERADKAMRAASRDSPRTTNPDQRIGLSVAKCYLDRLLSYHDKTLSSADTQNLLDTIPPNNDWLTSVAQRRPIFSELTRQVDERLNSATPRGIACDLRQAAMQQAGFLGIHTDRSHGEGYTAPKREREESERFLDAEIIAIYW